MAKMETGPSCVRPSTYVGSDPDPGPDRLAGILGKPIVSNGMTTAVKYSDNSGPPSLAHDLNKANEAARRSGSTYMPMTPGAKR